MKKYRVKYYFTGLGKTIIEAKSQEEADHIWREGKWKPENDNHWGEDFNIESIEEVKK